MIIVCGPNHSGTSLVAKTLLDNGFETRNYSKDNAPRLDYITYEDLKFRNICVALNKKQTPDFHYLKSLKGEKLFVKYPSAVLHLDRLIVEIPDEVKVVFCTRDIESNIKSFMKKTGQSKDYSREHIMARHKAIENFNGNVYSCPYDGEIDTISLLEFCK